MIFAAGLGTRLRPLTDHMPKALVPVAGVPMLERVILRLKEQGFDEIIVNIHHFGEQIIDFLQAKHNFGIRIEVSDERDRLLDTGGGIRKARWFLDGGEPFLVHNADILTDIDLKAVYQRHQTGNAAATLVVSRRHTSRYLVFDGQRQLCGWINKQTGETRPAGFTYPPESPESRYEELAFGGIHVISPSLFPLMEGAAWEGKFSIIPFYLEVCRQARIKGYPIEGAQWFDIGKPETLRLAEEAMR